MKPFYRPALPLQGHPVRHSKFAIRHFAAIVVSHIVLIAALALSLHWNLRDAKDHTEQLTQAYTAGRVDGILWARGIIILEAERLRQEEQLALDPLPPSAFRLPPSDPHL
jgi:hypothetical protein